MHLMPPMPCSALVVSGHHIEGCRVVAAGGEVLESEIGNEGTLCDDLGFVLPDYLRLTESAGLYAWEGVAIDYIQTPGRGGLPRERRMRFEGTFRRATNDDLARFDFARVGPESEGV